MSPWTVNQSPFLYQDIRMMKICGKNFTLDLLFREKIAILKGANENAQILTPRPPPNNRLLHSKSVIEFID